MRNSFNRQPGAGAAASGTRHTELSAQFMPLMGYTLLDGPVPRLLQQTRTCVVNTMNPHSFVTARHDEAFRLALARSDLLVADGVGMVLASVVLQGRRVRRVTGADIWSTLMDELERCGGRCMFVGSTPDVLQAVQDKLATQSPSVAVGVHSPPFAEDFSDAQVNDIAKAINAFAPDVVFFGLTAPKQEKLAERIRDKVDVKVIASIGAVFGFVAGGKEARAPAFLRPLGLEWLYRLMREPRRLYKRTFVSAPVFLWTVLLMRLGWQRQQS